MTGAMATWERAVGVGVSDAGDVGVAVGEGGVVGVPVGVEVGVPVGTPVGVGVRVGTPVGVSTGSGGRQPAASSPAAQVLICWRNLRREIV